MNKYLLVIGLTTLIIFNISCKKSPTSSTVGTVFDFDGNVYNTIQIGDQVWMAENLKVTHYRNGDVIQNVTDKTQWSNLTTGAYNSYDTNDSNIDTYGLLYNWYTVNDSSELAPAGWHIPSDEEWKRLEMYLGMSQSETDITGYGRGTNEGGQLKEKGATHWISPNTGATNSSGFSAVPGGYCGYYGTFGDIGGCAIFWSSTESNSYTAWCRGLISSSSVISRYSSSKQDGFSVRCLKD